MSTPFNWYKEPLFLGSALFIGFMLAKGFALELQPYYNALISYTGGGWPAVVELYDSLSLAIRLWFVD